MKSSASEPGLNDQSYQHQLQNELPCSVAFEVSSADNWVIHKKESYSNPI